MGLKLADVARQLPNIAERVREEQTARSTQLLRVAGHIRENRSSFLSHNAPPCPADYTVIATDGSQIDVDRHESTGCYLINVGWAIISYGHEPKASLDKRADVRLAEEHSVDDQYNDEEYQEVRDRLNIGLARSLSEFQGLGQLVAKRERGRFCLAMVDGPLVLWGAAGASSQNKKGQRYYDGIVEAMENIRRCALDGALALIGYTSYPGYRDVVKKLPIIEKDLLLDRHLFENVLAPGERSTPIKVDRSWGPEHEMYFFYIKTKDEIARIELPGWVVEDYELLGLAHAAILDQCARGQGYPVALQEAHEQAAVTAADRETFQSMVESALRKRARQSDGPSTILRTSSAKSRSKRTRWL